MRAMRDIIEIVETASLPTWVERVFALPDGAREEFDIDGVELSVAIVGINLPDDLRPVGLRHMVVPSGQRGQGKGGAILKALMAGADVHGRPLETDVYPYEERSENTDGRARPEQVKSLVDGYRRLGFAKVRDTNYRTPVAMVYHPCQKS